MVYFTPLQTSFSQGFIDGVGKKKSLQEIFVGLLLNVLPLKIPIQIYLRRGLISGFLYICGSR